MKEKRNFGFFSQGYEAPRAEGFEMRNEGLLCASVDVGTDNYQVENITIWGNGGN